MEASHELVERPRRRPSAAAQSGSVCPSPRRAFRTVIEASGARRLRPCVRRSILPSSALTGRGGASGLGRWWAQHLGGTLMGHPEETGDLLRPDALGPERGRNRSPGLRNGRGSGRADGDHRSQQVPSPLVAHQLSPLPAARHALPQRLEPPGQATLLPRRDLKGIGCLVESSQGGGIVVRWRHRHIATFQVVDPGLPGRCSSATPCCKPDRRRSWPSAPANLASTTS